MYRLSPPAVCVFEQALAEPRSAQRVERMLAALGRDLASVERVTDAGIPELVRRHGWADARVRQGALGTHADPALVFTHLRCGERPDPDPLLRACPAGTSPWLVRQLLGYGGRTVARESYTMGRGVCRSRVYFDTILGCPHGCIYCPGGKVAVVFTNLEEILAKQVIPTAEQEPWQKVFMFNCSLSDTPCFEPEYGLSKLLVEHFAATADQHYLIHTKSANTDFLRELDHRGHTIVLWSLTAATASRVVEPGTASPEERIEAARRCQAAGYTIRFKLKPIVPVKGWREEYRALLERLFARTRPDSIGLFTLAWMDLPELRSCLDLSVLDPAFAQAAVDAAETMRGVKAGPFPHAARAEVYHYLLDEIRRHDRQVPVFLCTETVEMWNEFAPLLGAVPGNYVCGCGPQCPPGAQRLEQVLSPSELATTAAS